MSWADKALRKHKLQKEIDRAMADPRYKEMKRKEDEELVWRAFGTFCRLGCEFLEFRHRYGHDGLLYFIDWMRGRTMEIADTPDYYDYTDQYYLEKYNLDLGQEIGVKFVRRKEG
jgi:hypothetical protein